MARKVEDVPDSLASTDQVAFIIFIEVNVNDESGFGA
jgi:hypothetical protein